MTGIIGLGRECVEPSKTFSSALYLFVVYSILIYRVGIARNQTTNASPSSSVLWLHFSAHAYPRLPTDPLPPSRGHGRPTLWQHREYPGSFSSVCASVCVHCPPRRHCLVPSCSWLLLINASLSPCALAAGRGPESRCYGRTRLAARTSLARAVRAFARLPIPNA